MAERELPSPEVLRQLLRYDPQTGTMYWRRRPVGMFPCLRSANSWNARYAGKETGQSVCSEGYQQVSIFATKYRAHRVVWAMVTGAWPEDEIDHINRDPSDNRMENLRDVQGIANLRNKGFYANNRSGFKGVTWHKSSKKWMAQIKFEGRNLHLGLFKDPEEAGGAYRAAAENLYGPISGA